MQMQCTMQPPTQPPMQLMQMQPGMQPAVAVGGVQLQATTHAPVPQQGFHAQAQVRTLSLSLLLSF